MIGYSHCPFPSFIWVCRHISERITVGVDSPHDSPGLHCQTTPSHIHIEILNTDLGWLPRSLSLISRLSVWVRQVMIDNSGHKGFLETESRVHFYFVWMSNEKTEVCLSALSWQTGTILWRPFDSAWHLSCHFAYSTFPKSQVTPRFIEIFFQRCDPPRRSQENPLWAAPVRHFIANRERRRVRSGRQCCHHAEAWGPGCGSSCQCFQ